jgi:hypothetical protein
MVAKLKIGKRGDEILIVHCCFSTSDLNVIFYQNMPNLYIGIYRLKEIFHRKTRNILTYTKAAMDN